MKKLLLGILSFVVTTGLFAQTTDVEQGSTHPYSVSVSNGVSVGGTGFSWSADAALGATFDNTNTNSVNVTFTGAVNNTGNVTVYATSDAPYVCSGNAQTKAFRIVSQLSLGATLPALAAICPQTSSNPTGGDIPSFTINFNDNAATPAPATVTGYSYQLVDNLGAAGAIIPVVVASATSASLDITSSYANTATGTYTIRIVSITDGTTTVNYPDASGNYPQTTIDVHLAPELSTF